MDKERQIRRNKIGMQRMLLGLVEHTTRVTKIPGVGWGCRVYVNGILNQEVVVPYKDEIGINIQSMLRMEDKCGNISDMASSSRMRQRAR